MDANPEHGEKIALGTHILWYASSVGLSMFSSVVRMVIDHDQKEIPRSAWAAYLLAGSLAGLLTSLWLFDEYQYSHRLMFLCIVSGFMGVQALSAFVVLVQKFVFKTK